MARRRGNSLNISVILRKAQRQGVSIATLAALTDRLQEIAGRKRAIVTDDVRINVDLLLREGIRLHPFLMQNSPIRPEQMEDLQLPLPRLRRSTLEELPVEDLSLPSMQEPF